MPTDSEWRELIENCSWAWCSQNGTNGVLLTSNINGNSIFLPAAGSWGYNYNTHNDGLNNKGVYGSYWSSSQSMFTGTSSEGANAFSISSNGVSSAGLMRFYGCSIRPVYEIETPGVSLNRTDIVLYEGGSSYLYARVVPWSPTSNSVQWKSNDTSVAVVDADGKVTGLKQGTAVITVTTVSGGYKASCTVMVYEKGAHIPVDMGLSVKWSSLNLGALLPETNGDYFAWGETEPKSDYSWSTYRWCNGSETSLTKYNAFATTYGTLDNKSQLESQDDAANACLGASWRTPTEEEWSELRNKCVWVWSAQNGVNGVRIISPTNGNSIFLPAAGVWVDSEFRANGSIGYYWTSSLVLYEPGASYTGYFTSKDFGQSYNSSKRHDGLSVRPVFN